MRLKSTLWQKLLIAVLLCVTCLALAPPVEASVVRVSLLVGYDEEWTSIANWKYGYSPEQLALVIITKVHIRFHEEFGISFQIVDYQSYDSDDSLTDAYARFDEAVREVTSVRSFHILVVFTGQLLMRGEYRVLGVSSILDRAVLASHQYPSGVGQATDRVLQHEFTHLYDVDDHFIDGLDCVMNIYPVWIPFPYYYKVVTVVTTSVWCDRCKNIISSNRRAWGYENTGGGGGGKHLIRPTGEKMEE